MNLDRIGAAAASTTYQARCKVVRMLLPEYIGSTSAMPDSIVAHLSSCLVCRAAADRLRQVSELLADGRRTSWTPPLSMVEAVMSRLDETDERHSWGKAITAGGIMVGLGIVVAVIGTRRRADAAIGVDAT